MAPESCDLTHERNSSKMKEVREEVREKGKKGELKRMTKGATLLFRDSDDGVETDNNVYVSETVRSEIGGEMKFRFKAGNFFQVRGAGGGSRGMKDQHFPHNHTTESPLV